MDVDNAAIVIKSEPTSDHDDQADSTSQTLRDEANFIQNVSQFYNQEALSDVILKVNNMTMLVQIVCLRKISMDKS